MPHWRTMIEKDHLGAWDLVDPRTNKPRPFTVTIESVRSVVLKTKETPKGKRKVVIAFREAKKLFVSNSTNCETIEAMYGGDTDAWLGKTITIFQTDVRNPKAGKAGQPSTVKGIRVKPGKPQEAPEQIPERDVDENMRREQEAAFEREPGSDDA